MTVRRVVINVAVGQPPTSPRKKRRSSKKRDRKSRVKSKTSTGGRRAPAPVPRDPYEPAKRKEKCVAAKSQTACEVKLESYVKEKPDVIDKLADDYVASVRVDERLVKRPQNGRPWDVARPTAAGGAGGRRCGPGRSVRAPSVEEYVVPPNADRLPVDLLPGTVVKKPAEKLVQLIAQAIHESPCQVLRVSHVYMALQMRYPYFMYLEKKALNSWKSSVRHALFQKWFTKLRPPPAVFHSGREKSCFWGLNYSNKPREWRMPGRPKTPVAKPPRRRAVPAKSSPPSDNEGKQWSAPSFAVDSVLPDMQGWKTAGPNRNGPRCDAQAQPSMAWGGQGQTPGRAIDVQRPLPPLLGPLNQAFHTPQQERWQPYWAPWSDPEFERQQSMASDLFAEPPVITRQDWLPFAEPSDYYNQSTDTDSDSMWDHLVGANVEVWSSDASGDPLAPAPALCSPCYSGDAPKSWEEAVNHTPQAATVSRGTDARNPFEMWRQWAPPEEPHPVAGCHNARPKSV
ncbi:uncharacterized protein LOC144169024 [Haemaphysalis longicornis]